MVRGAFPACRGLGKWWNSSGYLQHVTYVSTLHVTMLWGRDPYSICPPPLWRCPHLLAAKNKKRNLKELKKVLKKKRSKVMRENEVVIKIKT